MKLMLVVVLLVGVAAASKDKRGVYGEALGYDAGFAGVNGLYGYGVQGVPAAYAGLPYAGVPTELGSSVLIEKQVAVGVPQPYAVPVEKPVPYAVKVPYAVPVDREVPVDRPYPVPVVKHVPVPYEVQVPVKVPVYKHIVKHVPYPVEKIIREPVYIEKSAPPPVKIIVRKTSGWKLGGGLGHGGW
ncbi:zinc finger protein 512B-like [Thrips palmi]|uniref:Zinc finger protein 512B-like n=1 Tax=Thrips palmi TaxID=161013 RepID=A0A6P8ZGH1_THRPL|nr:zinc finger protein 512B-like [Thrips palmi]